MPRGQPANSSNRGYPMRRPAAVLLTLALAAGTAACGSAETAEPAAQSSKASSSRAPTPTTGTMLLASMTEAMQQKKTAKATIKAGVAGQEMTGTGAFRFGSDFAATLTMALPNQGEIAVVLLPGTFYLKLPKEAGLPEGKSWVRVAKGDSGPIADSLGPVLDQFGSGLDPEESLRYLGSATAFKVAGTETLDGVETTKYVTTVDVARLVAESEGTQKQTYQQLLDAGQKTLTATTWVGRDQLPRKYATTIDTPQGPVTAEGTYSDWGAPVDIQEPPAAEVVSAEEMQGGA